MQKRSLHAAKVALSSQTSFCRVVEGLKRIKGYLAKCMGMLQKPRGDQLQQYHADREEQRFQEIGEGVQDGLGTVYRCPECYPANGCYVPQAAASAARFRCSCGKRSTTRFWQKRVRITELEASGKRV